MPGKPVRTAEDTEVGLSYSVTVAIRALCCHATEEPSVMTSQGYFLFFFFFKEFISITM